MGKPSQAIRHHHENPYPSLTRCADARPLVPGFTATSPATHHRRAAQPSIRCVPNPSMPVDTAQDTPMPAISANMSSAAGRHQDERSRRPVSDSEPFQRWLRDAQLRPAFNLAPITGLPGCWVARLPPSKEHCFPAGGLIGPLCVSHRNLRKSRMLSEVRLPIMRFWNALIQTRRKGRPLPQVRLPTDGQKAPAENAKHIMGSRTPEMPSLERKGALETHNGRPNNRDRVTERSQVKGCQAYAPAAEHAARWSAYPRNPGGAPQAAGDQHTADGRHVPATGCSRGTPTGRSAERAVRPAHRFFGVARQERRHPQLRPIRS